jgi:hypothetical protein
MRRHLFSVVLALSVPRFAVAAPLPADPKPAAADVTAVKDKLTIWSDGKKHFVAMALTTNSDSPVFWSNDGKSFYQLRIGGGGSEGDDKDLKSLDRTFWEPRVNAPYQASLDYKNKDGKPAALEVQCNERHTALTKSSDADAKTLIGAATFYKSRWQHRAYALARDNTGKYYYVDRQREPEDSKSFRLWAGQKGALKPQKMVNVVSDSQGDIFSTKHGELRLIIGKQETSWIQNSKPTKLTWVPIDDNHVLIYTDLGVYTGEPLGTPCDDL